MENPCLYCGVATKPRCNSQDKANNCSIWNAKEFDNEFDQYVFSVYRSKNGEYAARHKDCSMKITATNP